MFSQNIVGAIVNKHSKSSQIKQIKVNAQGHHFVLLYQDLNYAIIIGPTHVVQK